MSPTDPAVTPPDAPAPRPADPPAAAAPPTPAEVVAQVVAHFGTAWSAHADLVEAQLAPVDDVLLAHADLRPGEAVLDVGCGRGPTARRAARRVGPGGRVAGVDVAAPLVAAAAAEPTPAVTWVTADASADELPGAPFDVVLSRFGTIFFAEPVPAMTHLARHVRPGGRLAMAVWQERDRSEIMRRPLEVAARVLGPLGIEAEVPPPDAGPFAWGDPAFVTDVLSAAGWVDVAVHPSRLALHPGGAGCSPLDAATMWEALGPLTAYRDLDDEVRAAIRHAVADDLAAPDGTITRPLDAAVAVVTAATPPADGSPRP